MTPLYGHIDSETAYVVDDYPYGFKLRCKIRYWLEYKHGHGYRLVSQTTNPKRNNIWNKPKASTYIGLAGCMYLDENNHVQWSGVSVNSNLDALKKFAENFPGINAGNLLLIQALIKNKESKLL